MTHGMDLKYDYGKYFSIDAWRKLGESFDTKIIEKYNKTTMWK